MDNAANETDLSIPPHRTNDSESTMLTPPTTLLENINADARHVAYQRLTAQREARGFDNVPQAEAEEIARVAVTEAGASLTALGYTVHVRGARTGWGLYRYRLEPGLEPVPAPAPEPVAF